MHEALLVADWPAPPGVRGFTTLRHGAGRSAPPFDHFNMGARCGDDPAAVAGNRTELARIAALPSPPVWLRQVHGTRVWHSDDPTGLHSAGDGPHGGQRHPGTGSGRAPQPRPPSQHLLPQAREGLSMDPQWGPEADAAVTSIPGNVLAILTADCLPVLLCADDGSEVGAAHAGWRGLAGGVLEATVAAMRTPVDRLLAWLGPAAGPQHYEVGIEVYDAFVSQDWSAGSAFTSTRPHHWRVDLFALARGRLANAGLAADRVFGGGLCTIADPQRFYSHRRDQRTGRMATVVWIEPQD